jgi:hypothetical protein
MGAVVGTPVARDRDSAFGVQPQDRGFMKGWSTGRASHVQTKSPGYDLQGARTAAATGDATIRRHHSD